MQGEDTSEADKDNVECDTDASKYDEASQFKSIAGVLRKNPATSVVIERRGRFLMCRFNRSKRKMKCKMSMTHLCWTQEKRQAMSLIKQPEESEERAYFQYMTVNLKLQYFFIGMTLA